MQCADIVDRLDDVLDTDAYADVDASANGLQVGPSDVDVDHVAFAVDAVEATIEDAAAAGADLLVTHHGLSWGGIERITDRTYRRIASLIDAELPLYVSHLPLDGHQVLGNAAGISEVLDLESRAPFGTIESETIGQRGRMPDPTPIDDLRDRLDEALDTGGEPIQTLDFGPETVRDVAIVTGSGADWLDEALRVDVDVFVTGEGRHRLYHEAREAGIHVVLGGHYATETFGVLALQELVSGWDLETTVIDSPTGL